MPDLEQTRRIGLYAVGATSGWLCLAPPAEAQFTATPTASVETVYSDNVRLRATDRQSELSTRLGAGLALQVRSARTEGFLNYSRSEYLASRDTANNSAQQGLASSVSSTLIDQHLFLNAGANISRASVSAFGARAGDGSLLNANSTEVRSIRVSPSVRSGLPGGLALSAQANWSATSSGAGGLGNSQARSMNARLGPSRGGPLGWSVAASHDESGFSGGGRAVVSDRVFGSLSYAIPAWDLSIGGNAGQERSNVSRADTQSKPTWGADVRWSPSPTTQATAVFDERAFGRIHQLTFSHRTPLTIWQVGANRSLNTGVANIGQRARVFDLLYAQRASEEPDPQKRTALVLAQLQGLGMDPNAVNDAGFLASSALLVTGWTASVAWRARRETVLLSLQSSTSRRADAQSGSVDDLTDNGQVRTRNLTVSLGHGLSPTSNLTLNLSAAQADGLAASQRSRQKSVSLAWTESLSRYLSVSAGLRRGLYDVAPAAYGEFGATASLSARF